MQCAEKSRSSAENKRLGSTSLRDSRLEDRLIAIFYRYYDILSLYQIASTVMCMRLGVRFAFCSLLTGIGFELCPKSHTIHSSTSCLTDGPRSMKFLLLEYVCQNAIRTVRRCATLVLRRVCISASSNKRIALQPTRTEDFGQIEHKQLLHDITQLVKHHNTNIS